MYPKLIEALTCPASYPHPVDTPIRVIETHISWIVLTGDFAYKLKKPVNFGFLDFTTLAQRQHFCEEELRLNQRLAPDIYESVVYITGSSENPTLSTSQPPDQEVIEYAVKMHQFDASQGLDKILSRRQFEPAWIDLLAEQIAHFHNRIPRVAQDSPWGESATIWQVVADNYTHIKQVCAAQLTPEDQALLAWLEQRTAENFNALENSIKRRKSEGHIRECHGDLHLGNITQYHGHLRLFDCIEFNLQFRWIDTLCDLAFLLMDLEANGQYRWSNRCLNHYLSITGDYQGLKLLAFYKSYRAMVRAKVATLSATPDLDTFHHYLKLTQSYTQDKQPSLLIMHGVSGSGKSYLSERLLERLNAIRIRSDVERKRLYKELSRRGERLDLYGKQMNTRTSQHLHTLAKDMLQSGYTVIVDATFIHQRARQRYLDLGDSLSVPTVIISCVCEQRLIEARLKKRSQDGNDASDANVSVMLEQRNIEQPLTEHEQKYCIDVETDDDQATDRLIDKLMQKRLVQTD